MTKTKGEAAVDMKWRRSKMEEIGPEDNWRKVEDAIGKRRLEGADSSTRQRRVLGDGQTSR